MTLQIAGTLAAGLLFATATTFAQAPAGHMNMDKTQDEAQHKAQWKDCMAKMEANNKGHVNSGGLHKNNGKTATTNKEGAKTQSTYEPKNEGKNEPAEGKMNHHEQLMQDCRNQLYGGKHEEPGKEGKDNGVAHN